MSAVMEWLIAALLIAASFFAVVGSFGLARLGDFMQRLHGPTKATTLGIGGVLIAVMLQRYHLSGSIGVRELLITLFLFLTAPISAHLLAKAWIARAARQRASAETGERD